MKRIDAKELLNELIDAEDDAALIASDDSQDVARYEQYNPYASNTKNTAYDYTEVKRVAFGLNYYPVPEIAIKAEYSNRLLKSQYNNEPSVSIGVTYE